jgi:phosphomannomutase
VTLLESLAFEPRELSFGTSGLRGLASDMTDLECYLNAKGFLQFLQQSEKLERGSTIFIAGDLRDSTPRILRAVQQAIIDDGFAPSYCGLIPTSALAYYALRQHAPCIMVTGSHIPADRNGIKFYKSAGEVLKPDEAAIHEAVADIRTQLYASNSESANFTASGSLKKSQPLGTIEPAAADSYQARFLTVFPPGILKDKTIVFYEQSAVGRDLIADILKKLGANVISVGRSDTFVPIDSENVTEADQAYFRQLAQEYLEAFAIISTDGDSDRPFLCDADGTFYRGDILGAITAGYLNAGFAAYPISASDAADQHLDKLGIKHTPTKIGSPYVIAAMQTAANSGHHQVTGWEVNGGFLHANKINLFEDTLQPLPTQDALLPILTDLLAATQANISIKKLFARLPRRFTQAGLIDNFPPEASRAILTHFSKDTPAIRQELSRYFTPAQGFGAITALNLLDGLRISFSNGDIAHLRPSSNAPQLRIYATANTQPRANQIVSQAIAEPTGNLRTMQHGLHMQEATP